jgi:hypothetical protein
MTLLEDVVERYPTMPWNWDQLSMNTSIKLPFIANHKEFKWNRNNVSRNQSITQDDILAQLYPLNYACLYSNQNLSYEFYNKYMIANKCVLYVDWTALSANPSITTMDLIDHGEHPWNDRGLSSNPNITSNFILKEGHDRHWYPPAVSANSGIQKKDIVSASLSELFEWDYRNLSMNPNLPLAYVSDNIDKDWNWFELSRVASMNDIERYHNFKWDIIGLSMNRNINLSYVMDRPDIAWNKRLILENSGIAFKDIYDNLEWFGMDMPEIKKYVSANETIPMEWIADNTYYVDWERMSTNRLS